MARTAEPPITLVLDPDDDVGSLEQLRCLHSRPYGRVLCEPDPTATSRGVALHLLAALGKHVDAPTDSSPYLDYPTALKNGCDMCSGGVPASCDERSACVPTAANLPEAVRSAARAGTYAGLTSQHQPIRLAVAAAGASVKAVRFKINYTCTDGSRFALTAFIYRLATPWIVEDNHGRGFSDWFGGPVGHDFHITGTFTVSGDAVRGTLHSLLLDDRPHTRCDSGHLSFRARPSPVRFRLPRTAQLTLAQFQAPHNGIRVGDLEAQLGPPANDDIYDPPGIIVSGFPEGVPHASETCLYYLWHDHPRRSFQFCFHNGRLNLRLKG